MTTLDVHDAVGQIRALSPMIRAQCADIDHTRAIPPSVIDEVRQLGLFRLLAPLALGGAQVDPVTFFEVVEEAASADGSVGWCVMIGGCYSLFAGILPSAGARDVFGDSATITAGVFRPSGTARRTEGGYRVSGRWALGSGSTHADWFLGGCVVVDPNDHSGSSKPPEMRAVFFPASEATVIDTWDSTGLRGTASHDYSVTDEFVPEQRTMWFSDPPTCDDDLFRMPPVGLFAAYVAAVPLGIARHAIEEFAQIAVGKSQAPSLPVLADKPVAHAIFGRASALVEAGRQSLVRTIDQLWLDVQGGRLPDLVDRRTLWLAATHAAHNALQAVEMLYASAGATSVYSTCPLDRCLRDVRTAVQHIVLQEANYEHYGRELFGRDPVAGPWALDYRHDR